MSLEPPPSREVDPLGRAWLKWFSTVREYFNNFALLAGSTTQTFSVGTATAAAHAVRLDQIPPPFRNRIVNGDMQVSQINGGTAVTPLSGSEYVIDQYKAYLAQASRITFQQDTADVPAGYKYALKITNSATTTAPGATDFWALVQRIEGQNLIDFQLGLAGAKTIAVSQMIKGSVAGTYSVFVGNNAGNRSYVGTINVTTSWAQAVITSIGDTAGTWATDNTTGLVWGIDLGSGSNFNTTAGSWQAGAYYRTSGSVTFITNAAATLSVTGLQIEAISAGATIGTAFEFLPFSEQLRRCQRYLLAFGGASTYEQISAGAMGANTTITCTVNIQHLVQMRAPASTLVTGTIGLLALSDSVTAIALTSISITAIESSPYATVVSCVVAAGLTQYRPYRLETNSTSARLYLGAQL